MTTPKLQYFTCPNIPIWRPSISHNATEQSLEAVSTSSLSERVNSWMLLIVSVWGWNCLTRAGIEKKQTNKKQSWVQIPSWNNTFLNSSQRSAVSTQKNNAQYIPTRGLMQILHFNWLRYKMTISNSPRVVKSVALSFVLFPNKYFFNLHLLTLLLPFLSD